MHRIHITDYRYEERILDLSTALQGVLSEDCDEHSLSFKNRYGKGIFKGINFDNGIGVMMIDIVPTEDIELVYELGRRHPIHFQYVSKGEVQLTSFDDDISHSINANEAMIYAPKGNSDYSMKLKGGQHFQCIVVDVIRFLFLRKVECDLGTIPVTLKEMFKDTIGAKAFYYKSTSEAIVVSTLSNIFKNKDQGLERKLLIEANSLKIITSLLKRYRVESKYSGGNYRFGQRDIDLINKAKNHLMDNLAEPPTVTELSQIVGMNSSKLQEGFNMLFDKSIRQFTITLRMLQARKMLDEGYYSISEIAYAIGYTNKGHFSKLFNKEFGLLPNQYVRRIPQRQKRS